jgi:AraC family transcriptional regulator, regulatory protein of adaptative response / DNA-3-methyladenine glycosylase II
MLPAAEVCERARLSRDPRFDGWFFIGVITTGIYCRPVCPARTPASENVRFYPSAAAAQEAGFRPCLRCLPEIAARVPEWSMRSRTVMQGLRLIDAGLLDHQPAAALAARLGVSTRHLNRIFHDELGSTPKGLAMARRRALAKRLLDETSMPLSWVAMQAGYGSLRRFNDDLQRCYGRSPSALRATRRQKAGETGPAGAFSLRLPVRQPYDAQWMFEFLARRALVGFEAVTANGYRRRILGGDGREHWISVVWEAGGLRLEVPSGCPAPLSDILLRVRRLFDLDADSTTIDHQLARDPLLAPVVEQYPGLRVPGAWDAFETAVRAVLGQQVSVDRATALAHRLLERFGADVLLSPQALARVDPAAIGIPGRRGEAIRTLAQQVALGRLELHEAAPWEPLQQALCAIPGLGPWTAGYVAMRVLKDPDAFPANDWAVLKMLAPEAATATRALARAEPWRPWRAYAVMYLWKLSQLTRSGRSGLVAEEAR